jgi:hypothetical protein
VPAHESENYLPAKYIVRMVDRHICQNIIDRYGVEAPLLSEKIYTMAERICREVLEERRRAEPVRPAPADELPVHQPAEAVTAS